MNKLLEQLADDAVADDPAHPTTPPHEQDDPHAYWRFEDLVERRVIADRADLFRKQTEQGFPRALKSRQAQGAISLFRQVDVRRWLDANLRPFDPVAADVKVPPGRPRKHPRSEDQVKAAE